MSGLQTATRILSEPDEPTRARVRVLLSLALLASACLLSACGGKAVAKVKTESDANEIMSVLTENGFDVEKEEAGEGETRQWVVSVRESWFGGGEAAHAVQVLNYYWLPRREDQQGADTDSSGVIPDPSAERAKQLEALERKVEKQVRLLPGVARTKVNIVMPEDDEIKLNPYKATASVTIVRKEEKASFSLEEVQNQVARSVAGLLPENVSVTTWYEPPPTVPREELEAQKHNRIIFFIVTVFVAVALAGGLSWFGWHWKKKRQQHDKPKAEGGDEPGGGDADDKAPAAPQPEGDVGTRRLGSGASDRPL